MYTIDNVQTFTFPGLVNRCGRRSGLSLVTTTCTSTALTTRRTLTRLRSLTCVRPTGSWRSTAPWRPPSWPTRRPQTCRTSSGSSSNPRQRAGPAGRQNTFEIKRTTLQAVKSWDNHLQRHIHTGRNRDWGRDQERMGCMKLCGSFHIKPGQGPRPIVPCCSSSAISVDSVTFVSCRSLYLMALNFSDKQKWVATLEAIITHSPDTFKRKDAVSTRSGKNPV